MGTTDSLPPADLSSAFAAPDRAGSIKLPSSKAASAKKAAKSPTKAVDAPADDPTGVNTPQVDDGPLNEDSRPVGSVKRGRPAAPVRAGSAGKLVLVLWSPKSIRARMQAFKTSSGKLYIDQVLDALESTIDDLPGLVAAATSPTKSRGLLFEREEKELGDDYKQLTIRGVLQSQLEVIDGLVASTGAGSRSKLINTALDETLPVL